MRRCPRELSGSPSPFRRLPLTVLVALAILVAPAILIALETGPVAAAADSSPWLDANGAPLPFASEDELLEFLQTAPVVEQKRVETGINHLLKVTLERDGVRLRGAFRTVDVEFPSRHESRLSRNHFRDSYKYEVIAYRLSRLLGLDRVPPTVLRTFHGESGSLQLWIENAQTEAAVIERVSAAGLSAPHRTQKQAMHVFDHLIYNFDRHQGNLLFDPNGRLWYIDHTRAFRRLPDLMKDTPLVTCDRALLERLRQVSDEEIRVAAGGLLGWMELDSLLKRRQRVVARLDQLIADNGSELVTFDLDDITRQARDLSQDSADPTT